jgi:2-polyprenyl-3-methyl-5-hydroxy-6-metoxy-1,4-benzoquinol methylase
LTQEGANAGLDGRRIWHHRLECQSLEGRNKIRFRAFLKLSYLDYYKYQTTARGVFGPEDIFRMARERDFIYEEIVLPWLPREKESRMVDLACGHGSFLWWLGQAGFKNVSGIDSSKEQVEAARGAGLSVQEFDVMAWLENEPAGQVDVLFAMDFIEHISKDDFMRFLRLSHRLLKPGGRVILRYPNGDSPFVGLNLFNDITHVWTYTTNCLSTLAKMHGFRQSRFHDEGPEASRDQRWIKRPLARVCQWILRQVVRSASRERVVYWNSSIWACLEK